MNAMHAEEGSEVHATQVKRRGSGRPDSVPCPAGQKQASSLACGSTMCVVCALVREGGMSCLRPSPVAVVSV